MPKIPALRRRSAAFLGLVLSACVAPISPSEHPSEMGKEGSEAEPAQQKADIIRSYKACLTRLKTDPSVDCTQYEKAVEILLEQPE